MEHEDDYILKTNVDRTQVELEEVFVPREDLCCEPNCELSGRFCGDFVVLKIHFEFFEVRELGKLVSYRNHSVTDKTVQGVNGIDTNTSDLHHF